MAMNSEPTQGPAATINHLHQERRRRRSRRRSQGFVGLLGNSSQPELSYDNANTTNDNTTNSDAMMDDSSNSHAMSRSMPVQRSRFNSSDSSSLHLDADEAASESGISPTNKSRRVRKLSIPTTIKRSLSNGRKGPLRSASGNLLKMASQALGRKSSDTTVTGTTRSPSPSSSSFPDLSLSPTTSRRPSPLRRNQTVESTSASTLPPQLLKPSLVQRSQSDGSRSQKTVSISPPAPKKDIPLPFRKPQQAEDKCTSELQHEELEEIQPFSVVCDDLDSSEECNNDNNKDDGDNGRAMGTKEKQQDDSDIPYKRCSAPQLDALPASATMPVRRKSFGSATQLFNLKQKNSANDDSGSKANAQFTSKAPQQQKSLSRMPLVRSKSITGGFNNNSKKKNNNNSTTNKSNNNRRPSLARSKSGSGLAASMLRRGSTKVAGESRSVLRGVRASKSGELSLGQRMRRSRSGNLADMSARIEQSFSEILPDPLFQEMVSWNPTNPDDRAKYDDVAIKRLIKRNPDALKAKYTIQVGRFSVQRSVLSTIVALGASLDTVRHAIKAHPVALEATIDIRSTPLHAACSFDTNMSVVRHIYNKYPEAVRATTQHVFLPLHNACQKENPSLEMIQFLVDAYPEGLTQINKLGDTPYRTAVRNNTTPKEVLVFLETETERVFNRNADTQKKRRQIECRQSWGQQQLLAATKDMEAIYADDLSTSNMDADVSEISTSGEFSGPDIEE